VKVIPLKSDLIVLGAGPAGISAALAAAETGALVTLIDENHDGGGQVYRPSPSTFRKSADSSPELVVGDEFRRALEGSAVQRHFKHVVWNVAPGFRVDATGPQGTTAWCAPALVVATGTSERVIPFPGWTTPGVIGLGAATILLKSQRMLPGRSTVVAGCGPLLAAVAVGILKAGGEVRAIIDLAGATEWLRRMPALTSNPKLLGRGAQWIMAIRRSGIPIYFRHGIRRIEQNADGLNVTYGPVDKHGVPRSGLTHQIEAECVAVGHGLIPSTEVTRILRAQHHYDRLAGGWIAVTSQDCETSIFGLFVTGDAAGIAGADAAARHGRLAGLAAAHRIGHLDTQSFEKQASRLRSLHRKAKYFGAAMGSLMALRPGQVAAIEANTIVCRCEDVTRQEIDTALDEGATNVNQIKAWTRCGMGPCQGRSCGDVVGELVGLRLHNRELAGYFTGRPPLRPVRLNDLTGQYDYSAIPIPKAAPL